jgi:WD40 repeat protein
VKSFDAMAGRIYAGCFNKDGTLFAAGSSLQDNGQAKGEARVYNVTDSKVISTFEAIKSPVYTVAFAPDGKRVAVAGFDGMVRLHDPTTGKLIKEFAPAPVATASK